MEKANRKWILASVAVALVSAAALSTTRSPASERRAALLEGGPFEGTLTVAMDASTMPKPMTITYEIKGSKARFALPAPSPTFPAGYAIVDQAAEKSWMVVEDRRTVLTLDAGKAKAEMAAAAQMSPSTSIEKTGTFDTVAGYRCEKWEITLGAGHLSACVLAGIDLSGVPAEAGIPGALGGERAFPLRAIYSDAKGVVTRHTEVRAIERKAIDDSRFTLPEGYAVEDALKLLEKVTQD